MPHVLISHFGTLLGWDAAAARIVQCRLSAITNRTLLLHLPETGARCLTFTSRLGQSVSVSVPDLKPSTAFMSGQVVVMAAMNEGEAQSALVGIQAEGRFLRVSWDGYVDMGATKMLDWERFLPISDEALADLIALSRHTWLMAGARLRVNPAAGLTIGQSGFSFGGMNATMMDLPLAEAERVHQLGDFSIPLHGTLFREGWKHDKLTLFNPLVVFVVFGNAAFLLEQFQLATMSLAMFGLYAGDILVIGDQPRSVIEALLPPALKERLLMQHVLARDRMDVVASRLMIGEIAALQSHQPVLYADVDIFFDAAINKTLEQLVMSERFSAQVEHFSDVTEAPSVGSLLFRQDPMTLRDRFGFNAGLLGMPGVKRAGPALRIAKRALAHFAAAHGRDGLPWYEQSMLNYSLRRLDLFTAEPITSQTQIAAKAENLNPAAPRGFVHFWPAQDRVQEMRLYMQNLLQSQKAKHHSEPTT